MSRVLNANEFLQRFRRIREDYERIFGPRIAEVRSMYDNGHINIPQHSIDENLIRGQIYVCPMSNLFSLISIFLMIFYLYS